MAKSNQIPFQQILDALLDEEKVLPPGLLYRLSDLTPGEANQLRKTWPGVPLWRRQVLMEDLQQLGEADTVLFFDEVCRVALKDSDPKVRTLAVRTLREYEMPDLIPVFLEMMEADKDAGVRANAAATLGPFVYLGEIEELPEKTLRRLEDALLRVTNGQDETLVRRRALEALSFSGRDELFPLIEAAYSSGSQDWLVTALFAMGRSANEYWSDHVMSKLDDPRPEVRYEAISAAGELEIEAAVPYLLDTLEDEDEDVLSAAIWSLSQIGGEGVRDALEQLLDEAEDEDEANYLEAALDNLSFTEDMSLMPFLDTDEADLDDAEEELVDEEDDEDARD